MRLYVLVQGDVLDNETGSIVNATGESEVE